MSNFSIAFTPKASAVITATTTTGNIDLGATTNQQIRLQNGGSVPVYFALGADSTTAATVATSTLATTSHPILPGAIELFTRGPTQQYLALITGSSTAAIYISTGHGS